MTIIVFLGGDTNARHASSARQVPRQPRPVLTANDHDARDEKAGCNWQSDDAQGRVVCNNNNNTQARTSQVGSGGIGISQMSHRSWSLHPI